VTLDRENAMVARFECRNALNHPYLPQQIKDLFKRAYDHAGTLLLLDGALPTKKAKR
jgi:hypothetical protein